MSGMRLIVATPGGNLFDGPVGGLFLRGCAGDLAVLPGHIPFVTSVQPGICRILLEDGTEKKGQTEGGLLAVSGEVVTLLAGNFRFLTETNTFRSIL